MENYKQSTDEQTIEREFSGFQLSLTNGSKSKTALCNKLKINVPNGSTDVSLKFNIRQAKALQKFLNDNLK